MEHIYFLRKFHQQLDKNEVVLHIGENISPSFDEAFFPSILLSNSIKKKRRAVPFLLITSKGIRVESGLIPWRSVFDITFKYQDQQQILVFWLSQNIEKSIPYDLELDVNTSYKFPDFVFLGGSYNAEVLYRAITIHWKPVDPNNKLSQFGIKLSQQYSLVEGKGTASMVAYHGDYRDMNITCAFDQFFPFASVYSAIKLNQSKLFYLVINKETSISKTIQTVGKKDIQIGWSKIDKEYHFECSHPEGLKSLFNRTQTNLFELFLTIGSGKWTFGKPIKQKRLKTTQSSPQDTDDVLDSGLLQTPEQESEFETTDDALYNTLEFNGTLHSDFENDPKIAIRFIELSMEFSVLLAEGIKEL